MLIDNYLNYLDEAGFENMPDGWTKKSVDKAGNTLAKHVGKDTPKDKGFFKKCVSKMQDKIDNPEGYCASLKDESYGSTFWRGKNKTKKETNQDVKKHQNV